jgi:hypothetical protein
VRISRQNQRLLFTLMLVLIIGLLTARLLEKGVSVAGDKERALALSESLAKCTTRDQYLALLKSHYPPASRLWQAPALTAAEGGTTAPASLEQLPDGRLKVAVFAMKPAQLLERGAYVYVPAALADDRGHGYRLEDIRLNSRKADLVFEYYFRHTADGARGQPRLFHFFMGNRQWEIQPAK